MLGISQYSYPSKLFLTIFGIAQRKWVHIHFWSFLSSCEQFDVLLQNWYSLFTIKVCSWTFFSQLFRDHFPGVDETWHATGYEPSPGESGDVWAESSRDDRQQSLSRGTAAQPRNIRHTQKNTVIVDGEEIRLTSWICKNTNLYYLWCFIYPRWGRISSIKSSSRSPSAETTFARVSFQIYDDILWWRWSLHSWILVLKQDVDCLNVPIYFNPKTRMLTMFRLHSKATQVSSSVQTEVLQSSEKSLTMTLTVSFPNIAAAIINAVLLNFAGALSALLPSVSISASPKGFQRLGSVDRCLDALRKDQLPLLESCALVQAMKHPNSNVLVLLRLACFFQMFE